MNRPDPRRLADAKNHRSRIDELLERLDVRTLGVLLRMATYGSEVDGFGGNSGSEVRPSGISDSVMAAIVKLAGGREAMEESEPGAGDGCPGTPDTWANKSADPVGDAIVEFFGELAEMAGIATSALAEMTGHARRADRLAQYVLATGDGASRVGRSPGGRCDVCDRVVAGTEADRLRGIGGGFGCDADRMAWERAGRPMAGPDWNRWATERRAFLAAKADPGAA